MTYVTCPIRRYHPAVVAQLAATTALLSDGRFSLGLGSGENLNEHVVGGGWPPADIRHEMLTEAVEIIQALFDGGDVNHRGKHFDVESARLFDVPDVPPPIGIAVSGAQSCALAGRLRRPDDRRGARRRARSGLRRRGRRRQAALRPAAVSFDRAREAAVARAHEQFRWFGAGWKVNCRTARTGGVRRRVPVRGPEDVGRRDPVRRRPGAVLRRAQNELLPALRAALR